MKWPSNSHNKISMLWTLYSKQLYTVDIIFRSQLTLPPGTEFSIADTSNIRHFLLEMCINFTLGNVLQFHLSFLRSLVFYFLASLMAFSGQWKCRYCKFAEISCLYSSLWLTCFPVAKMSKAQWDRDTKMDTKMDLDICCKWSTTSPFQWELVWTKETVFLSTLLISYFTCYKHSPTSGF